MTATLAPVAERETRQVLVDDLRGGMETVERGYVARVRFLGHGVALVIYESGPPDRLMRYDLVDVYVTDDGF